MAPKNSRGPVAGTVVLDTQEPGLESQKKVSSSEGNDPRMVVCFVAVLGWFAVSCWVAGSDPGGTFGVPMGGM